MSDTGTSPVVAPPADPAAAPAAPQTPRDFEKLYHDEVAARINERNLNKPAQQMLNNLDEGSRAALLELGELARQGDPDAIIEWNLRTIQQVSGKDAATIIAERQARAGMTGAAPTEDTVKVPTEADINQMVAAAVTQAQNAERAQNAVRAEMKAAGYNLDSAPGETIIRHAVQNNLLLPDAIAWYEADTASTALERARAAAAAAASIPGAAPAGTPVGATPDSKPAGMSDVDFRRQSILAKLTAGPSN